MKLLQVKVPDVNRFDSYPKRHALALYLAGILAGGAPEPSVPYQETPGNDMRWVVDQGNNWWLEFHREDDTLFHIQYRGGEDGAVEWLTRWVAFRYGPGNQVIEKAV